MFGRKNKKPVDEGKTKEVVTPQSNGFFSTDLGVSLADATEYIQKNAFPVIPSPISKVVSVATDGTEETVAMDSLGFAMDGSAGGALSYKAAFKVNNQLPENLFCWYVSQSFIGYQACSIINQHWLVNKSCLVPAQDAARKGYKLTVNDGSEVDPEVMDKIRQLDKKYRVKHNLIQFEQFRRVFGIRICYFQIESPDQDYYEKPFNIDGVRKGSYKGMVQVDPMWITPQLDANASGNPASQEFYEPTWWVVNGKRIHRSHLIVTRYSEVPDVLKPTYQYGGLPMTQLIWERVYAAERTANEAPQLAMTKRTTGLYIDMEAAVANQEKLEEKMSFWSRFRDNFGIKILGQDEKMEQFDTSLADLDAVIMTQYQIVAGIANIPITKLLGTTPKGFNSSGDYEIDTYNESLESIQEDCYDPLLERHYELLLKSEGLNFAVDVVWNPLKSLDAKEMAEVQESKSRTATAYSGVGAIDGFDVRKKLAEDPDSDFSGIEVDDLSDANESETEVEEEEIGLNPDEKAKAADQSDWISAIDAIENGYVSVRPRVRDAAKYYAAAVKAGIQTPIEPDKLHCTLMYSEEAIPTPDWGYNPMLARPTGEIRVMGEGEYRAIVVMLESSDLQQRHDEIKLMGGKPRHDVYLPHISLVYNPSDADIALIPQIEMPEGFMILQDERWASAKD